MSTFKCGPLKLVEKFTYLGGSVSLTENDTRTAKAWTAIDRLISHMEVRPNNKMQFFFQAAVLSVLLYECTTWTLTKRREKRIDGNYTRMLQAILNKSWRQHPIKLSEVDEPDMRNTPGKVRTNI